MIFNNLMWSSMVVVMVVVMLGSNSRVVARSVDGVSRIEKLLSSSSSSSPSALGPASMHSLNKRAVFDQSCKGIYDRELFRKLDRVCGDCYNLYRKPYVSIECSNNCYNNLVFRQCLDDLMMQDVLDDYVNMVRMVGK